MVVFICGSCGESVKKAAVDKHCQTQCRNCSTLSCIDCGKTFPGDTFRAHNSCMTEEEKWHGKDFKAKESSNSGRKKQDAWTESIQNAITSTRSNDHRLKMALEKLLAYDNVPRKEARFKNFLQNSMRVTDQRLISSLWDIVGKSKEPPKTPSQLASIPSSSPVEQAPIVRNGEEGSRSISHATLVEDDPPPNKKLKTNGHSENSIVSFDTAEPLPNPETTSTEDSPKFKWRKAIKNVLLGAADFTMSEKKLRKKVVKLFESSSGLNERSESSQEYANRKYQKFLHKHPDQFLLNDDSVTLVI